jgi:hypothetical protein
MMLVTATTVRTEEERIPCELGTGTCCLEMQFERSFLVLSQITWTVFQD